MPSLRRPSVRALSLLALLGLTALSACRRGAGEGEGVGPGAVAGAAAGPGKRPVVAVSVAPQAELVERLAAGAVEVITMIPPGTDVETYAPSPHQMAVFSTARIYFEVGHPGLPLEASYLAPWLARHPEVRRVSLAVHAGEILPLEAVHAGGHPHGDPHLWVSVRVLRGAAVELAGALAELLPAEADSIRTRARALDAELAALDAEIALRFRGSEGRRFLVYHPALGYFARDYGLVQEALETDGKEPSPARLAELVESARRAGVRVVLSQRGMPPRSVEILAATLGAKVIEIDPLAADGIANLRRIAAAVGAALIDG